MDLYTFTVSTDSYGTVWVKAYAHEAEMTTTTELHVPADEPDTVSEDRIRDAIRDLFDRVARAGA